RGEDPGANWSGMFEEAERNLDQLTTAANDAERQKIWASAYAIFLQGAKLLSSDPVYTHFEAKGIIADHLHSLQKRYSDSSGRPFAEHALAGAMPEVMKSAGIPDASDFESLMNVRAEYLEKLARSNITLPGRRRRQ